MAQFVNLDAFSLDFRISEDNFHIAVLARANKMLWCFLSESIRMTDTLKTMKNQAAILNAMANQKRLEILQLLQSGETNVTNLARDVQLSQSAVSQHLAKLRKAKLVETRRDAQTIYYTSSSPAVVAVLDVLNALKK